MSASGYQCMNLYINTFYLKLMFHEIFYFVIVKFIVYMSYLYLLLQFFRNGLNCCKICLCHSVYFICNPSPFPKTARSRVIYTNILQKLVWIHIVDEAHLIF